MFKILSLIHLNIVCKVVDEVYFRSRVRNRRCFSVDRRRFSFKIVYGQGDLVVIMCCLVSSWSHSETSRARQFESVMNLQLLSRLFCIRLAVAISFRTVGIAGTASGCLVRHLLLLMFMFKGVPASVIDRKQPRTKQSFSD